MVNYSSWMSIPHVADLPISKKLNISEIYGIQCYQRGDSILEIGNYLNSKVSEGNNFD
jgi:hypothetical protein